MTQGIFVTGTDTGVGKTVVATGLARLAVRLGRPTVGLKPVASGACRTADGLRNEDALALAGAGSLSLPYHDTNPFCFEPAVAPHIAAADAGVPLPVPALVEWYQRVSAGAAVAVVEGAGGWRVPLHPEGFLSDLPEQLGLGVLIVVGLRLGCLNHARLTLEAIERGGRCPFLGWVGNRIDPEFARPAENVAALERLLGRPALAILPRLQDPTATRLAELLDRPAVRQCLQGCDRATQRP